MSKPELIVPIRDRREHRRILTLKNFRKVVLAALFFFLGLTIHSDLQRSGGGEYGRLFGKQVSGQTTISPRKFDPAVVTPIEDRTAADPLLVSAAAREQYLGVGPAATATMGRTETVTGPTGVTIVVGKVERSQPTLSGGIFRQ